MKRVLTTGSVTAMASLTKLNSGLKKSAMAAFTLISLKVCLCLSVAVFTLIFASVQNVNAWDGNVPCIEYRGIQYKAKLESVMVGFLNYYWKFVSIDQLNGKKYSSAQCGTLEDNVDFTLPDQEGDFIYQNPSPYGGNGLYWKQQINPLVSDLIYQEKSISEDKRGEGWFGSCWGNTFDTSIQITNVSMKSRGDTADVKVSYSGSYYRKNYVEPCYVAFTESFDVSGQYSFQIIQKSSYKTEIIGGVPSNLMKYGDPNHDSNLYAIRAVKEAICSALEKKDDCLGSTL